MKGLFAGLVIAVVCVFSTAQLHAASYQMHTVKSGETYYSIASDYGTDVNTLQSNNGQSSYNLIVGDLIKISQIKDIKIQVNGVNIPFDERPYIENGRVFVPIRFVSEAFGAQSIDWNEKSMTAEVKLGGKNIAVYIGSKTAFIDGRAVNLDVPAQLYNGRTFVPVRFFSEAFDVDNISWNQSTYTVSIEKKGLVVDLNNITPAYSDEDLYWLSRLVEAEAAGEPYEGKVAVADTVINRKESGQYPDTIKGVIFDENNGVQYSPILDGSIYNTPSQDSINAARDALGGNNVVGNSMYFVNPSIAESSWIQNNRTYYSTIQNHVFYL